MSINVTVSGNPVNINRGKMVTSDYAEKKEFEKRRLLRLEQVRQQSKELAEDVRNKVRKEKKKQMGEIEKEGKEKLKSWQNRKLLELQNQYREALDDIGVGHKEAEELEYESDILAGERLKNEEKARNRGRQAGTKQQVQKNEDNYKKAKPIQHKKLVRDIENTRAALVSCMEKNDKCQNKAKKPKASANINITIPDDSNFNEESSSESTGRLPSIQEENSENSEEYCECSECSIEKALSDSRSAKTLTKKSCRSAGINVKTDADQHQLQNFLKSSSRSTQDDQNNYSKPKSYQESIDDRRKLIDEFRNRPREISLDTRISDRIKHRQNMAHKPDFCDEVFEPLPFPGISGCTRLREQPVSHPSCFEKRSKDPLELSDQCICCTVCPCKVKSTGVQTEVVEAGGEGNSKCKCHCSYSNECKQSKVFTNFGRVQSGDVPQLKEAKPTEVYRPENVSVRRVSSNSAAGPVTEIPFKPPVKLKTLKQPGDLETKQYSGAPSYKVRHYDFPNRFESEIPSTSQVEKITADSLDVIPNAGSEAEWNEKMRQRDREAQLRGKRALEKERVQRDYEDMMKKLPVLQRKEHIARIGTDKPEYHMSEERLKQRERERQNRLENAYSQAVPELRPQIITIPSRKHEIPRTDEPFEILDGDDPRTLNLGQWDTETEPKKMFSAEEVQEIIKAFTIHKPEDRKTKLKQLLKSLKLQKEQLLNEIQSLPKDDSINALISDLNSFSDSDERLQKTSKNKKRDKEKGKGKRGLEDSDTSSTSDVAIDDQKAKDRRENDHLGKSPSKKMKKSRPRRLVLQNISTQTTPKASKEKTSTTTSSSEVAADPQKQKLILSALPSTSTSTVKSSGENDVLSSEEVCKILIKLNEDDSPKVEVVRSGRDKNENQRDSSPKPPRTMKGRSLKSPSKEKRHSKSPEPDKPKDSVKKAETKSVATETDTFKKPLPKEPKKRKPTTQPVGERGKSPNRSRNESWKEHLSKNSMSTSSTSYFSPPDFSRPNTMASTEGEKHSLYNLRKKPQQRNLDRPSTARTPTQPPFDQCELLKDQRLLNYIKRLLGMSKISVDELGVSSSEVQTPNESVVELETNNPMAPLHNIIKLINLRAADVAKEFTISSGDGTPVPPNSAVTFLEGSGSESKNYPDESQQLPEKDAAANSPEKGATDDSSLGPTQDLIISKFTDVTDSCSKRIAHLAAMIEQLREEKIQMLQHPPTAQRSSFEQPLPCDRGVCDQGPCNLPRSEQVVTQSGNSDKDNSTRYFDFPPSGEKSKGTNSTASMDEEEINRRLLEIDMSLAEKLKRFRQTKDDRSGDSSGRSDKSVHDQLVPPPQLEDQPDQVDQEFLRRLQGLVEKSHEKEQLAENESPGRSESTHNSNVDFVPLLIDIPKLPILEPQPEGPPLDYPVGPEKRHPPPSKGLITAKKYNGNISLVPHELSTIVEADSQLSTRISPNASRTCAANCANAPLRFTVEEKSLPIEKTSNEISNIESYADSEPKSIDHSDISLPKDQPKSGEMSPPKSQKSLPSMSEKSAEKLKRHRVLDFSDSTKSLTCNDGTCTSLMSGSSKQSSSSSTNDGASIEAMLKSIGMDWAIPTLHKTQEALALTSSSSSGSLSGKGNTRRRLNSSSESSLKEFLKKQLISKISSSSLNKSSASPASFLRECSEMSAIQANSSAEKGKQRTSTPLMSSKNTSKAKEEEQQLFTGASDISSVRDSSCSAQTCSKLSGKQTVPSVGCNSQTCTKRQGQQTFHTLGSEEELSYNELIKIDE